MKKFLSALLALCIAFSGTAVMASNLEDVYKKVDEAYRNKDKAEETPEDVTEETPEKSEEADETDPSADPENIDTAEDESDAESEAEDESEADAGSVDEPKQDANSESDISLGKVPAFLRPTDYLNKIFGDIMDLYIERHLYEFTKEELMDKFIYDLIAERPELYTMLIDTMLGTMDKYSAYHEKTSNFLSLESSSAGYGVVVTGAENGILIENVLTDSEAQKAGLLPGDILVGVGGLDISTLPQYAVSEMLRRAYIFTTDKGEDGKYADYNPEITFTVNRNGELLNFTFKKGLMISEELSVNFDEENKIAYIAVYSFVADDLADKFNEYIKQFEEKGYKKLVIDLRDNGGGALDLAMSMAETFVENGETMCYYNDRVVGEPQAIISDTPKVHFDSISVLVNENTASAAELMASILRNKAGAVLVGNKTYGKALGQSVMTMPTGDYFTITTYEILDANGESYNDIGLVPELTLDNVLMLYDFPKLEVFNHTNYKEIIAGVYSEPCLALEKRLQMLGYMRSEQVDGIWDNATALSVYVLQTIYFGNKGSASLDDKTVSLITDLINNLKYETYYEDSQLDVALLYHSSMSQAKRLIAEKEKLAKKQAELIEESEKKLKAEEEAAD